MQIRLSPSGPVVGSVSLMPVRLVEDTRTRETALVLTGVLQDASASLRAELDAPFDLSHYYSAECEIDMSNASTNVLAVVDVSLQVSFDALTWQTLHTETHSIGANDAGASRQIQPIRCHAPPLAISSLTIPAGATTVAVRAAALVSAGETGKVQIEDASEMWVRLVENSAA